MRPHRSLLALIPFPSRARQQAARISNARPLPAGRGSVRPGRTLSDSEGRAVPWRSRLSSAAVCLLLCALVSAVAMADYSPVRAQTFALEKQFTERALALWGDDRYMFFLQPQAYFVDHFGVVLTTDLNIAPGPIPLMAFRGPMTKPEIAAHKRIVLERMPKFRQFLKSELLDAAAMFPGEPDTDRLSIAVTIYHFTWEDTADIPTQIVAQGVKKDLLGAKEYAERQKKSRKTVDPARLDQAIEMRDTE